MEIFVLSLEDLGMKPKNTPLIPTGQGEPPIRKYYSVYFYISSYSEHLILLRSFITEFFTKY